MKRRASNLRNQKLYRLLLLACLWFHLLPPLNTAPAHRTNPSCSGEVRAANSYVWPVKRPCALRRACNACLWCPGLCHAFVGQGVRAPRATQCAVANACLPSFSFTTSPCLQLLHPSTKSCAAPSCSWHCALVPCWPAGECGLGKKQREDGSPTAVCLPPHR